MRSRLDRTARVGGLVLVCGLALAACGGEESPATTGAPLRAPSSDSPPEAAGPLVEDPTFELRAEAQGPYASGEAGAFEVRLTPRGQYHVNEDYPMTVTVAGPDGVSLPDPELGNDDAAELTATRARFSVPFVAAAAGEHRVTADVDFAVCTPTACMPERRTLALVLPVQ